MKGCSVCGERVSEPMDLCWGCAGLAGDALVFVRPPESAAENTDVVEALVSLLPGRARADDLSLTARGHKAVALIPMDEAERVRRLFRSRGVEVEISPRASARAPLPVGLRLVVGSVLVAGMSAGLLVEPILLATSPLVAGLLWFSAQRRLREPLEDSVG